MDSNNILSLLGLALRGGRLVMGEEPVEAVARARDARVLLLASDAADNTRRRVEHFAEAGACLWLRVPFTKAELGRQFGRTSVAVAAVTDVGLASAVVNKLAQLDPRTYGDAAERLELKAKRAAERRAEQQAHEKNLRTGKRKVKKAAPPEEPVSSRRNESAPNSGASLRSRTPGRPLGGASSTRKGRNPVRSDREDAPSRRKSRPSKENRPKPRTDPYAHSRPVKKGKGSFRKKEQS